MPRPRLKDERKRRISTSITIRKDLREEMEASVDGISKTIESAMISSKMISEILSSFYEHGGDPSKDVLLELIEKIDDASCIYTSCFDDYEKDDDDK